MLLYFLLRWVNDYEDNIKLKTIEPDVKTSTNSSEKKELKNEELKNEEEVEKEEVEKEEVEKEEVKENIDSSTHHDKLNSNLKPTHIESHEIMNTLFGESTIRKRSLINSAIKTKIKEV